MKKRCNCIDCKFNIRPLPINPKSARLFESKSLKRTIKPGFVLPGFVLEEFALKIQMGVLNLDFEMRDVGQFQVGMQIFSLFYPS